MSIYSVDPRGLTGFGYIDADFAGFPNGVDATLDLGPQGDAAGIPALPGRLRELSDETGGFAAVNRNDFQAGVQPHHA